MRRVVMERQKAEMEREMQQLEGRMVKSVLVLGGSLFLMGGVAAASASAPSGDSMDVKVMLLIGAFVVGLLMFVWIASKLMGPQKPLEEENPFIPFGIGDEEDIDAGDG